MKIEFTGEADDDLQRLNHEIGHRVVTKIYWLVEHFIAHKPEPLIGTKGIFKLRVGDWRVVYEINYTKQIMYILRIGHRSKIYKRL